MSNLPSTNKSHDKSNKPATPTHTASVTCTAVLSPSTPTASVTARVIALSALSPRPGWNARSDWRTIALGAKDKDGAYTAEDKASQEGRSSVAMDQLADDMERNGQLTPAVVRPDGLTSGKYVLVCGNKRAAACKYLADNKRTVRDLPPGHLRVEVVPMTDLEARSANLRENGERDDLASPDWCYGIMDLADLLEKKNGKRPTTTELAIEIGKSQSFVNRLVTIGANLRPEILATWRQAPTPLGTQDMLDVASLSKEAQQKGYDDRVKLHETKPKKADGRTDEAWIVKACDNGAEIAAMLARGVVCGFLPDEIRGQFGKPEEVRDALPALMPKMPLKLKNGDAVPPAVSKRIAAATIKGFSDEMGRIASKNAIPTAKELGDKVKEGKK